MSAIASTSIPAKQSVIQKYPLATFIVLAFGLTWTFLIADALGSWGIISFRLPLSGPGILLTLLTGYCPTIAAVIVTGLTSGREGIRKLFGRILRWRASFYWYVTVIFGTGVLFFIALQLNLLFGGTAKPMPPGGLPMIVIGIIAMFLVNGLVNGEEFGWRGFALPRLQAKNNALVSSLILGLIWVLFHLPLFFTKDGGAGGNMSQTPFIAFVLNVLAGSVLVTWLFNNTRGSVLFAYLFHAAFNTWTGIFASTSAGGSIFWMQALVLSVAAVIVILVYGPTRLSCRPFEEQQYVIEN
jgi:membrane protease YdiL (CAAX protease family)